MRVLFSSMPATGHFNSTVPMANALAAAGHNVAFSCAPAFAEDVKALGFEHFPGGAETFEELFEGAPRFGDETRTAWVQSYAFATRAAGRLLPDLMAHIRAWQPDLLVHESGEYAAILAGEQLSLPHASIATGAWSARDDRRAVVAVAIATWRIKLKLPPDPETRALFRYLDFSFMPARWDGLEPGTHATATKFIRYENPQRPGQGRPDWLDQPREVPLVLASLGTVMHAQPGLFEAIIEALADEPMEVVAAIGRDQDPARFGTLPANVRIEPFVPQIPVLERCDLFVTHGGFNSTKESLSLGIPLVVIPIGGDQPYGASRVEALGLGRQVGRDERNADIIRARVREVTADPSYRANARAFAEEMAALPAISHAVELLEGLVAA